MSAKLVTHLNRNGHIICGLKQAKSLTAISRHVTCKRCLKMLGVESQKHNEIGQTEVVHHDLAGLARCTETQNRSRTVNKEKVTCPACLEILNQPVPAIAVPKGAGNDTKSDWRWPLDADKLDQEMERRKIKLYGYYEGRYRRKITWFPYSRQLEVQCEDSSWRFSEDHHDKALERYNDPKLYVADQT